VAPASPFAIAVVALAFGRAVTARRRAPQEVQRIFELSLDLVCVVDLDGRFVALNPSFERTLGYPPEQMLGRPFMDFVHTDDREASEERFKDVLGGDEVTHFENRYIRPDGSKRWLEWSACAAPEQRAVYATARDVTERRRIDAERRRIDAEQAALRRVATLVARQAPQTEIRTARLRWAGRSTSSDWRAEARLSPSRCRSRWPTTPILSEKPPRDRPQFLGAEAARRRHGTQLCATKLLSAILKGCPRSLKFPPRNCSSWTGRSAFP
jgi:PAS domain S-box-containing protein